MTWPICRMTLIRFVFCVYLITSKYGKPHKKTVRLSHRMRHKINGKKIALILELLGLYKNKPGQSGITVDGIVRSLPRIFKTIIIVFVVAAVAAILIPTIPDIYCGFRAC